MTGLRLKTAIVVLLTLVAPACHDTNVFRAEHERFRSIRVGMTEREVRDKLGQPVYEYDQASAPSDYYVKGYSFRARPITNKVLIYVASEPIAYIYIDHQNRVEEVFVGGS
jgi:hypothetical protein